MGGGIVWLGMAAIEAIARDALDPMVRYTSPQNALRWGVGAVLVVAGLGTEAAARIALRVVGVAAVGGVAWGLVRPIAAGRLLGFEGPLPVAALVVYLVTGVIALLVGFAGREGTIRP